MKNLRLLRTGFFWALTCATPLVAVTARAGSTHESLYRESLLTTESLDRWTISIDYKLLQRDVKPEQGPTTELRATIYSASLGFDVFRWITLYASAGGSEAKFHDLESMRDMRFCWAGGLHAYLWNWESDRQHDAGLKLSLEADAEYAHFESGSGDALLEWTELSAALPFKCELSTQHYDEIPIDFYSFVFYAGPAVSKLDGSRETGGHSVDFDADRNFGVYGGMEIYLLKTLSLGARVEYFDAATAKITARYHF